MGVVFDAGGEGEKVDSTEEGYIRTDYLAHGKRKDIQRKSSVGIVGAHALFQRLHIALTGRESKKAALMVEHIFKPVGVQFLGAQKIAEDRGRRRGQDRHNECPSGCLRSELGPWCYRWRLRREERRGLIRYQ